MGEHHTRSFSLATSLIRHVDVRNACSRFFLRSPGGPLPRYRLLPIYWSLAERFYVSVHDSWNPFLVRRQDCERPMSYVGFRPSASQTRVASVQVSSDCSASGCLLKSPPPVPPFLRNARGGKTREGLSSRCVCSGQAPGVLRRSSKSPSSRVFSPSKHSAPADLAEGGDAPANAGAQRRKGVCELRTVI